MSLDEIARAFKEGTFHPARAMDKLELQQVLPIRLLDIVSMMEQDGKLLIIGTVSASLYELALVIVWYSREDGVGYEILPGKRPAPSEYDAVRITQELIARLKLK